MTEPVYSTLERTHAHTYVRTDNIEMEFLVHRDKGEKKKRISSSPPKKIYLEHCLGSSDFLMGKCEYHWRGEAADKGTAKFLFSSASLMTGTKTCLHIFQILHLQKPESKILVELLYPIRSKLGLGGK